MLYFALTILIPVLCSVVQLCLTLCDPKDCSLPVSSVLGILQARILEWVVMPSSRRSSSPRDGTQDACVSCTVGGFFTAEPWGSLFYKADRSKVTVEWFLGSSAPQPAFYSFCAIEMHLVLSVELNIITSQFWICF